MATAIERKWVGPADVLRALTALKGFSADPDRTDLIGEFIGSLTGPSAADLFEQVWSDPVGRSILAEGRDLGRTLGDRDYLSTLPAGSLGRAYFDWTASRDFTAEGIAAAISSQVPRTFADPGATMGARVVDMHDLWHVLNEWDSDIHGEIHLLGYSYAQLGAYAWLGLGLLSNLALVLGGRFSGLRYLWDAVGRGREAAPLVAVDWEAMLPLPIDEVRQRLGIAPPTPYERLTYAELADLRRNGAVFRMLRKVTAPFGV